jgi:hypothetical protein
LIRVLNFWMRTRKKGHTNTTNTMNVPNSDVRSGDSGSRSTMAVAGKTRDRHTCAVADMCSTWRRRYGKRRNISNAYNTRQNCTGV